jgi:hypothetical protein
MNDDWKKVVQWAEREQQEEKRKAREHFKRTCRNWPMIAMATGAVGGLAFLVLDPTRGIICTIMAFVASALVVEHFS